MKTFLFDTLNRYKRFSESLDTKTILSNKTWWVFNDSGEKEVYIFQEDGTLLISSNGIVTDANWQFIPTNKSLVIKTNRQTVMLIPSFVDNNIFCLQLDGTNKYVFLIDENNKRTFTPKTLVELESYFKRKAEEIEQRENKQKQNKQKALLKETQIQKKEKQLELQLRKEENEKIRIEQLIKNKLHEDKKYINLANKHDSLLNRIESYKGIFAISLVALLILFFIGWAFDLGASTFFIALIVIVFVIFSISILLIQIASERLSNTSRMCNKIENLISKQVRNQVNGA